MSPTDAAALFRQTYGRNPDGVFSAPGRVNLIGEHTDYNGGLVLPFAIDARANLAAGRSGTGAIRVVSAQKPGEITTVPLEDIQPGSPAAAGWPGYLLGAIWSLQQARYPIEPVDLVLDSQIPSGAGLSSSAAVECVTVLAVSTLAGHTLDPLKIAGIAQRAENDFVGVPCGPMDQTASAACRAGSVLLFDTRAGTTENIPFDPAARGLTVLVVDTRVAHSLADGQYGKRRASCEQAAKILSVSQLRDIPIDGLPEVMDRLPDDELRRRVRHVVTENNRVRSTVDLLRQDRVTDIGDLLTASHASLRDDYDVSCAELDQAVETALAAGALGARMTGGGFGGSVIALGRNDAVDTVGAAITTTFADRGFITPVLRRVTPAQGARQES
ncbi:MAG TPA: galactokinase [Nakamurella sp.]